MPIGLTLPQYVSGCGWTSGSPYASDVDAMMNRAPSAAARSSRCSVADRADPQDLQRQLGEVGRAGRRREVHDRVEPAARRVDGRQRLGDVGLDQREPRVVGEVGDVVLGTGDEVVDGHDACAPRASSASTRCEPTKPAPPVTRIRCPSPYRCATVMTEPSRAPRPGRRARGDRAALRYATAYEARV